MRSELNEGALFHSPVPRRAFEIEGAGGTEVVVRHGRETCRERPGLPVPKSVCTWPAVSMAVFSPVQLIASVPPLTRFFTLATLLLSLFYLYLQWKGDATYPLPYLTLVPGTSLFYPWTFFTSAFVETSIYEVCCHPLSKPTQLMSDLAHLYANRHPSLSALPREALGCRRDPQIYRRYRHFFQYHRIWLELDRVRRA